jgi:hypothetical protein
MPIGALIAAGGGLLGSMMQADATKDAARTAANAQLKAGRISAGQAAFRPVGMSTRLVSSQFTFGIPGVSQPTRDQFKDDRAYQKALTAYNYRLASEGRVTTAVYELSPELKAYQDRLSALTGMGLGQAEAAPGQYAPLTGAASSLFNLGQQYLAQSPEEVAQKYMTSQLDLLAPQRERQYAQLQNQLYNTGRTGLSVGATGLRPGGGAGLSAANPELEAYYNAIAQQDAQLAAQAQEAGQRQLGFGTTLFGTGAGLLGQYQQGQVGALAPYQAYLGGVTNLESLGQQPLSLGASLGGGNTASAQALLQGGLAAANTMLPANMLNPTASFLQGIASNPQVTSGISSGLSRLFGSSSPAVAPPVYSDTDYARFGDIYGGGGMSGSWAF